MKNEGTLLVGVLAVLATLALSAYLMAFAPWVAGAIVISGLIWLYSDKGKPKPPTRT